MKVQNTLKTSVPALTVHKIGKLNKANKSIKMQASNDRVFDAIANRCDQGANRLADRKAKRQAAYDARQK